MKFLAWFVWVCESKKNRINQICSWAGITSWQTEWPCVCIARLQNNETHKMTFLLDKKQRFCVLWMVGWWEVIYYFIHYVYSLCHPCDFWGTLAFAKLADFFVCRPLFVGQDGSLHCAPQSYSFTYKNMWFLLCRCFACCSQQCFHLFPLCGKKSWTLHCRRAKGGARPCRWKAHGMDWGLRYPEEPTTRVDNDFGIPNINLHPWCRLAHSYQISSFHKKTCPTGCESPAPWQAERYDPQHPVLWNILAPSSASTACALESRLQ